MEILNRADAEARRLNDSYISTSTAPGLDGVAGPARELLRVNGVDKKDVEQAIKAIRAASGVQNVTIPARSPSTKLSRSTPST